jgi:hypothetical protein
MMLSLTSKEILDLHGGRIPDTVREKLRPLAESVVSGTFLGVKDPGPEKYCRLVLENKATVSAFSQTLTIDGIIATDLTILSSIQ